MQARKKWTLNENDDDDDDGLIKTLYNLILYIDTQVFNNFILGEAFPKRISSDLKKNLS